MEQEPLQSLRRGIFALVVLGTLGLGIELIVLEHYGDWNQLIPLVVIGLGLLAAVWVVFAPGVTALRVWQFAMLLFVGTGVTGVTMHVDVASQTVNPPLLAPGSLVQLGLLGLLYTFRHPGTGDQPLSRP